MTREIKFRAWNKKNSKMVYQTQYAFLFTKNGITVDKYNSYNDYDGLMAIDEPTIMQFTGLLDKNGKEIYEGDIVKVLDRDWSDAEKDTRILIVYYRNDRYLLINKAGIEESEKSEPNIYNQEWYEVSLFREYGRDRCEIIGNIYENPELLK